MAEKDDKINEKQTQDNADNKKEIENKQEGNAENKELKDAHSSDDLDKGQAKTNEQIRAEIRERRQKRLERLEKKNKKKSSFGFFKKLVAVLIVLVVLAGAVFVYLYTKNRDCFNSINSVLNSVSNREIYIDGEKIYSNPKPIYQDEEVYIPTSVICANFEYNALYDKTSGILSIATDFERVKLTKDQNVYYVNGQKNDFGKKTFIVDGNGTYIASGMVEKFYNLDVEFSEKYETLAFETTTNTRNVGVVETEEYISNSNGDKVSVKYGNNETVNPKAMKGDYVSIYNEKDGDAKIMTSEGFVGYISSDSIGERSIKESVEKVKTASTSNKFYDGKVEVLFEQVSIMAANYNYINSTVPIGVDVLVPTWFSFKVTDGETDGTVVSLADKSYISKAHKNGVKVWGLISDNFNSKVSRKICNSATLRESTVNQIVKFVEQFNIDGINVDFENIPQDAMRGFTQFLRELSAELNNKNKDLSIDVYIPRVWSSYYNRKEFGEIVDYFIVMGYDEHTDSSDTSGSVATKQWSEDSITLTEAAGVPQEKLILAIPFYTRAWRETADGQIESSALGMEDGYNYMKNKGADFKWDDEAGQNYAEISSNGERFRMWLEDEKSVAERLKIINKHDIAGVAAWRRGLEKTEVWPIIKKYMKG